MSDDIAANEERVRTAVAAGEVADFTRTQGYDPGQKPSIRAAFLRRIMLGQEKDKAGQPVKVLLPGVRIKGAHLDGVLDLADCAGAGGAGLPALLLEICDLPQRLDLSYARLARLSINEGRFRQLWAVGLKIDGDLSFTGATPAPKAIGGDDTARIQLRAARIGGDLWGTGAQLNAPGANALDAQAATIGGIVGLQNGFSALGCIWLLNAKIGGALSCAGGRVANIGKKALVADSAEIGGAVLLLNSGEYRFEAEGAVSFQGAKIDGPVSCDGGRFVGSDGIALLAGAAEINGSVLLRAQGQQPFEAHGRVSLLGTKINGNLECDGGRFANPGGHALLVDNAEIGGAVLMRASAGLGFEAEGQVSLLGARIARDLELIRATLKDKAWALNLQTTRIEGQLLVRTNTIDGTVSLAGLRVARLLDDPATGWGNNQKAKSQINLNEIDLDMIGAPSEADRPLWRARARWLRRNTGDHMGDSGKFSNQPWRQVAGAFERAGLHGDGRRIRREEQREANKFRPFWQRPFVWVFADLMFGFGLSARRAIASTLFIWAIGIAGASIMQERGALVVVQPPEKAPIACQNFQAPLYALDVALPVLDLKQESMCEPGRAPGEHKLYPGIETPYGQLFEEIALWTWAKALYAVFGALVAGFALLTWSGVFKPRAEQ